MEETNKKLSHKTVSSAKIKEIGNLFDYSDEAVKDFDYADFVGIASSVRGMIFSFGKAHPHTDKPVVYSEILIPLDIVATLNSILTENIKELKAQGVLTEIEVSKKE